MTAARSARTASITIRVTEADRARIDAARSVLGASASDVVRAALAYTFDGDAPVVRHVAVADPAALAQVRSARMDVQRVGVNLNQLTRRAHTDGLDTELAADILQLRETVLSSVGSLTEAAQKLVSGGGSR